MSAEERKHCWHSHGVSYSLVDRREWVDICCHCGTKRAGRTEPAPGHGPHASPVYISVYEGGEGPCEPRPLSEYEEMIRAPTATYYNASLRTLR